MALKDERVVPIKGNAVTRRQNVQVRPEGHILSYSHSSEIQEVCQIPVERPSIQAFSSSSGLYQVVKNPYLALLRKVNVRIIIYLDDMLSIASSPEDLLMARDTLIFIFQHLHFLISIKKSYLEPTSTLEFFGVMADSGEMTLSHSKEKFHIVQNQC